MAETTTNFKLTKPSLDDNISPEQFNENFDILDDALAKTVLKADNAATTAANALEQAVMNRTAIGDQAKNLLDITATSQTLNGITFIVNDDKTITVSGTATSTFSFIIGTVILNGNYILSGCPTGGSSSTYRLRLYNSSSQAIFADDGDSKTIYGEDTYTARIYIVSGTTVDGLIFKPMIRDARITDDTYVPYVPSVDERLKALLVRVEALEAAATTTDMEATI